MLVSELIELLEGCPDGEVIDKNGENVVNVMVLPIAQKHMPYDEDGPENHMIMIIAKGIK